MDGVVWLFRLSAVRSSAVIPRSSVVIPRSAVVRGGPEASTNRSIRLKDVSRLSPPAEGLMSTAPSTTRGRAPCSLALESAHPPPPSDASVWCLSGRHLTRLIRRRWPIGLPSGPIVDSIYISRPAAPARTPLAAAAAARRSAVGAGRADHSS